MKRKIREIAALAVMMICVTVTSLMPSAVAQAEENTDSAVPSRKIVSVVYDDSGSMSSDAKWACANYAVQSFAALLSSRDQMYLTYMSDPYNPVAVDLNHVDQAVENIRTNINWGGTPIEAVETAMQKLEDIQESDADTQFWLVILTDGQTSGDINALLDSYKGTTMSNGSSVYITYMGIGDAIAVTPDEGSQLSSSMVPASSDIVDAMAQIANRVSGRLEFADSDVTQVDSRTLQVHSTLPLYSIAVFSQRSHAQVVSAEEALQVDRNVAVQSPTEESGGSPTDETLYGNAAVITNGSGLIQPGDYTITFSEDVDPSSVVLMYQPAIVMQANVYRNGVLLSEDDLKNLVADEQVDVEIIPINPGTGQQIPDSDLPDGITWSVDYVVGGNTEAHSDDPTLNGITVKAGESYIDCTMTIPDFTPQTQRFILSAAEEPVYEFDGDEAGEAEYYRSNMGKGNSLGEPVRFYILVNGTPMTKDQIKKLGLDITEVEVERWESTSGNKLVRLIENFGWKDAKFAVAAPAEDGSFELYPAANKLSYLFVRGGKYTVTVTLDDGSGISASGVVTIIPRWTDIFILLLWLLTALVLYLIFRLVTKKRFARGTLQIDVFGSDNTGMGTGVKKNGECEAPIKLGPFTGDWWNPLTPYSSFNVKGLKIYADDIGGVSIRAKTLQNYKGFGGSGADPEESYDDIMESLKENKQRHKTDLQDASVGNMPYYLCTGNRLKRLRVR